jgi:VanZ family protein
VRWLLLVIVALILYGSLYPFHFDFDRTLESPVWVLLHSWPTRFDRFLFRDAVANVLFYAPLGFVAVLAFGRRWWAALLLGTALSAGVEMMQVYDVRTCSLFDVVCNVAGTAVGAVAGLLYSARRRPGTASRALPLGPLIVGACWAGYQFYPFLPLLSRGHLGRALERFHGVPFSPVEAVANTAEWFAAALVIQALWGRFPVGWFALTTLALPVRLLLADRALAPAEIAGAVMALLLWAVIPERRRRMVGTAGLALAILLRELTPFHFAAEAQAFSWMPFSASLGADRTPAVVVLFRKAFNYGAMVWLLSAAGTLRVGVAVAAALFVLEWSQRYLPNHQPEITDAILVLIMTVPLLWSRR